MLATSGTSGQAGKGGKEGGNEGGRWAGQREVYGAVAKVNLHNHSFALGVFSFFLLFIFVIEIKKEKFR